MMRLITEGDLLSCLYIFHHGYETVAKEFVLTSENCPDRGRADLPYDKLRSEFNSGKTMMYGYFAGDKQVGFISIKIGDGVCKLNDIIVLPEYRRCGYGTEMLSFCKHRARELGAAKMTLGMIDENKKLRKWYESHGFVTTGYVNYEGAPFTVGKMECVL